MFSCEFCEISHNTIFKEPNKLSISTRKAPVYMFEQVLNTPLSAATERCSKVKN